MRQKCKPQFEKALPTAAKITNHFESTLERFSARLDEVIARCIYVLIFLPSAKTHEDKKNRLKVILLINPTTLPPENVSLTRYYFIAPAVSSGFK